MFSAKKIIVLFILFSNTIWAQTEVDSIAEITHEKNYLGEDFDFTLYLLGNGLYEDAVTLVQQKNQINNAEQLTSDSLNYIKGWTFYSVKELEKASNYFDSVSSNSVFYAKSVFFNSLANSHLGLYKKANNCLDKFTDTLKEYTELYYFEKAGLALLENNLELYKQYAQHFSYQNYVLKEQQQKLQLIYEEMRTFKKKSPWVAGIASAVVPGLGKVYTGQIGEGVSSFLTVGSLAAITAENWVKAGPLNWKTLLFGTLGTVFYIGNIYGSVATVKIYYDEFNHRQNHTILYCIHIPLRTFFN